MPRGGNVFLGWNDGNPENPRVINVTSNVTCIAQFAACTNTGIENVQANAPLKVFPNPTNSIVNVELERATVGTLALFDLNGRVVETRNCASLHEQINLSAFLIQKKMDEKDKDRIDEWPLADMKPYHLCKSLSSTCASHFEAITGCPAAGRNGNDKPDKRLVKEFNTQTNDGKQPFAPHSPITGKNLG